MSSRWFGESDVADLALFIEEYFRKNPLRKQHILEIIQNAKFSAHIEVIRAALNKLISEGKLEMEVVSGVRVYSLRET